MKIKFHYIFAIHRNEIQGNSREWPSILFDIASILTQKFPQQESFDMKQQKADRNQSLYFLNTCAWQCF